MVAAPKDGRLYGLDRASDTLLYRTPVTRIENVEASFAVGKEVRFCPGVAGGAEWNSPAYDPRTNLILAGEIEWCTTVSLQTDEQLRDARPGQPWFGNAAHNPLHLFGRQDQIDHGWAGWLYAVDADSGVGKWRLKSKLPDRRRRDADRGRRRDVGRPQRQLLRFGRRDRHEAVGSQDRGAIGGGLITYSAGGGQKIAVATGLANVAIRQRSRPVRLLCLASTAPLRPAENSQLFRTWQLVCACPAGLIRS